MGIALSDRPNPLLEAHRFLRRGPISEEHWSQLVAKDRDWERSYRGRWAHDKVVRSTHGVNCTGSCSWNVYVKDGLITWESQAVDYPSTGPEMPDYEPRGCPRGASFSWYTYSPLRVKYPYVRGSLLAMFREARERLGDPVDAWAEIVEDPEKSRLYKRQRGKGGFVRASWEEAVEMIAAAHVHTIKRHGPDRVVGFSPIPAMSMASYAAGTRFLSLIGGMILSFYDWYADLPPSSPQSFGDQTDVPESGDWWNAGYLLDLGHEPADHPHPRRPLHDRGPLPRPEGGRRLARLRRAHQVRRPLAGGRAGPDGAMAMAMGHVILKEFYVERETPYFRDYARRFTDLPLLVTLRERDGAYVPDRLLRASDLEGDGGEEENGEWKPVLVDERTGRAGGAQGVGRPPLRRAGEVEPEAGRRRAGADPDRAGRRARRRSTCPASTSARAKGAARCAAACRRSASAITWSPPCSTSASPTTASGARDCPASGRPATTTPSPAPPPGRSRSPASRASWWRGWRASSPATPRSPKGRSMIAMGAGTNHWFHSDQVYRTFLALVQLCGCEGVNGGGWAHYVGQEKVRPLAGWQTLAFALDWTRPPRHQSGTPFFYLATDQWRYERQRPEDLASPLGRGLFEGKPRRRRQRARRPPGLAALLSELRP